MADVTIETAAHTSLFVIGSRGGPFWTSPTVGYVIYVDGDNDLVYKKTSDGGATWAAKNVLLACGVLAYDCWADWQTPGDAGTVIHIAFIDGQYNDVYYVSLDTSDDSEALDKIEDCQGTGTFYAPVGRIYHAISITKARGGNLAVSFQYRDTNASPTYFYGFYTSPDATTWTSKTNPREHNYDHCLLFPGNEADNQDLWATYWDDDADIVSLKTFDNSGNSWSEQQISASMIAATAYLNMDGAIRFSDGHLVFAAWSAYDAATADLNIWDINGAASITAKTDILTNSAESVLVSVFINHSTDDIYVAYAKGTTWGALVKIFYKKSTDGGANWGSQTAMQADAEDDEKWVSCGAVKVAWGGKFQPVWFNDDTLYLYTNTTNGISIGVLHEKSLSDTVAVADSIIKTASLNKADSVSLSESVIKSVTLVKDDAVAIADAIVKGMNLIKAESIAIADSVLKTIGLKKSESVSISDVPSKAVSLIKTEAVAIGDSVAKTVGLNKADTVTIGDTIAKLISLVKADAVAIADTFSRTVSYALSLADNVGITDSIRKTISIVRTDALPIIDSMVSSMGAVLTIVLFDIVTITDRLVGELRTKAYLKQAIARMQVKGMDIARVQVKRMNIAKTHLFR